MPQNDKDRGEVYCGHDADDYLVAGLPPPWPKAPFYFSAPVIAKAQEEGPYCGDARCSCCSNNLNPTYSPSFVPPPPCPFKKVAKKPEPYFDYHARIRGSNNDDTSCNRNKKPRRRSISPHTQRASLPRKAKLAAKS